MKYIISTIVLSIIIFFVGGWISDWSVFENAAGAWILVSAFGGLVGSLPVFPFENEE